MSRKPKIKVLPKPETPKAPEQKPPTPPDPKPNIISINELVEKDKRARVSRAVKAIDGICEAERVQLVVNAFGFNEGRLFPQIAVRALEQTAGNA